MADESGEHGATAYVGPVTATPVRIRDIELTLARPADPDRLLEAADVRAWNAKDDYMPYWAYLWPGAFLLADSLAGMDGLGPEVSCLEIGCGLGLAGLVALARGARVHFTDYDRTPLSYVARSIEESGLDPSLASYERLDWRELPDRRYDLILGADVLYERRLVPLVADLVAAMLGPNGQALVAGPYRVATEDLPAALESRGLAFEATPLACETAEMGPLKGTLHRIYRR